MQCLHRLAKVKMVQEKYRNDPATMREWPDAGRDPTELAVPLRLVWAENSWVLAGDLVGASWIRAQPALQPAASQ